MLRQETRKWSMDQLSISQPGNFSRTASVRLHGFQQKRAVRRSELRDAEIVYLDFARAGNVQMVEKLLRKSDQQQLDINCTDYFDRTALVLAITNRHGEMIQCLLKYGVDLTESLFYAIENEYVEAVEYILNCDTGKQTSHCAEMLITSEESIFPRFLSAIMLAAHKNNYEILETLHAHGHRLRDLSDNASNKWDAIRLKWLYYKARASQAYMILMYNKAKVDPLNEAIDFYGRLKREGLSAREVRENYSQLANQCEDFAIGLLAQLRTAQELADILRFTLVGREHGNTNQLALNTLPMLIPPIGQGERTDLSAAAVHSDDSNGTDWPSTSDKSPAIRTSETRNGGTLGRSTGVEFLNPNSTLARNQNAAETVRSITNAGVSAVPASVAMENIITPNESDQRRLSQAMEYVPEERRRTLGIRRPVVTSVCEEYARPIHFLKPIEKAVDNGMIRLVTCENSQLALTYLKDGILFRDSKPEICLLQKFIIGIMFPFISIAFYFLPNSKLGLVARNPTAKLWMEVASDVYLIFLLVANLILSEMRVIKPYDFSPILIVAYFWMPGKFLNLMFLAYHQGKRVIFSIWNWNDMATILLYTVFMILRIYGVTTGEPEKMSKSQWAPIPLSDMMISVVYILVFIRPLEILRVNRTFGPLQLFFALKMTNRMDSRNVGNNCFISPDELINVSVDRMMKDVSKFFLLFLVIWFAFSSGINTLFWRYSGKPATVNCSLDRSSMNVADIYCCFPDQDTQKFTNLGTSLQVHFWSIFGYSDDYAKWFSLTCPDADTNKLITKKFGEAIFALYHVGTVLVLVNMLIAIMSGTLQKTIDDSDIQWQFHRTRVWIRFIRTGFYRPPPMNLLPRPKEITFLCSKLFKGLRSLFKCGRDRRGQRRSSRKDVVDGNNVRMSEYRQRTQEDTIRSTSSMGSYCRDPGSPSIHTIEETVSRYDVALRKCVKRYLKTQAVQSDEIKNANVRSTEDS